ncbi:MAG: sulfur oxidation c-type cytochrome SoxA [Halothiobacillaceae bacterium]|nr:sulfur oxidation c-type cytochrome SoxA [Halothiobacillaceae bacterium]
MKTIKRLALSLGLGLGVPAALMIGTTGALANSDEDKFAAYRDALGDENPGEFFIDDGKKFFHEKRGPKNENLEKCDFGLGPGVLKGAYAQLPRYFADTGKVETLEGRILGCMVKLQGFKEEDVLKMHYQNAGEEDSRPSELAAITSYIAAQSNGLKFDVKLEHAAEKNAYEMGKKMFWRRQGWMDLSCADCHANTQGKLLRGVELPDMTAPKTAGKVMTAFPAYVLKDANVRTQWWRNERCVLAMRLPWLKTGSELDAALTLYMSIFASQSDEKIQVPGIKPRA